MTEAPLIFLIAGEPSGDALGGPLIRRLKEHMPDIRIAGVGGPAMTAGGLESLFPMSELSVMGIAEVLPRIPSLLARIRETAAAIGRMRPDAVVTIDSPDFTHRVAARIRHLDIPVVHYVAPTVWAWRAGRARKLAAIADHVMTLFPFEPPYFERVGLAASFVGHPVVEEPAKSGDGPGFRKRHEISSDAPVVAVLPGSRRGELARHLPVFGETLGRVADHLTNLSVIVPTLPHLADQVGAAAARWAVPANVIADRSEFENALAASDAALAASGTIVLELARAGLPAIVGYRLNPLTGLIAQRMIRLDHVSLINIICGRTVMPEFLLGDCQPDRLAPALQDLLQNDALRAEQKSAFDAALAALRPEKASPSSKAADVVLDVVRSSRQSSG